MRAGGLVGEVVVSLAVVLAQGAAVALGAVAPSPMRTTAGFAPAQEAAKWAALPGPKLTWPAVAAARAGVPAWNGESPPHVYDQKALGYSVRYTSPLKIKVDVYVYDGGLRSIPDDIRSQVVRDQFRRNKGDIHTAKRQGLYQSVEETSQGEVRIGSSPKAPRAHHARFRIERQGEKLLSDLYLTVYQGQFVKIRCSRPDEKDADRDAAIAALMEALGKMLEN